MKRLFDIIISLWLSLLLFLPMLVIAILIKLTSKGPILYWSDRIGRKNKIFKMPKFRTMRIDTPEVATHLLENPEQWVTSIGKILRRLSFDELPQLWNILIGEMSLVGPRPALFNQHDLIELRTERGVDQWLPGLTGWAQVNGRDELSIQEKVELDQYYSDHWSFFLDIKIIISTISKVLIKEGVKH